MSDLVSFDIFFWGGGLNLANAVQYFSNIISDAEDATFPQQWFLRLLLLMSFEIFCKIFLGTSQWGLKSL